MKKLALCLMLTCLNTQAHWFHIQCSSADGSVKYEETKMYHKLTFQKEQGDDVVSETLDYNWENELIYMEADRETDLGSVHEGECTDGFIQYYTEESTAAIYTFTLSHGPFPQGTLRASEDLTSLTVPMVCLHTSGGASSCAD